MRKNYNFTRRKLYLPEYGRHIHEMVDSLLEIEDRQERTRQAKAVIAVMGNLNPMLRDTSEFKHKLWDHLYIMSDFRLDVDSPYPQPSRQDLAVTPQKLRYSQSYIRFKHYGKYAQQIIETISKEDSTREDVKEEVGRIARFMRAKNYEFKNEHPNNETIVNDIRALADGNIDVDVEMLQSMRHDYRHNSQRNAKNRKSKMQRNNGRRPSRGGQRGVHHTHK